MSENKYETTLEVWKEWEKEEFPGSLKEWLEDKIKPKDPLFKKWTATPKEVFQNFALFKERFADELDNKLVEGVCCDLCEKFETDRCPVKNADPWSRHKDYCGEFEPEEGK